MEPSRIYFLGVAILAVGFVAFTSNRLRFPCHDTARAIDPFFVGVVFPVALTASLFWLPWHFRSPVAAFGLELLGLIPAAAALYYFRDRPSPTQLPQRIVGATIPVAVALLGSALALKL
jgi:hypothetical protein